MTQAESRSSVPTRFGLDHTAVTIKYYQITNKREGAYRGERYRADGWGAPGGEWGRGFELDRTNLNRPSNVD